MGVYNMFWLDKTPFHSHVFLPIHWDLGWIALAQVLCKQSQLL